MKSVVSAPRNSWWGQAVQNRLVAMVLAMIVIVPFIATPADRYLGGVAAFVLEGFAIILAVALLWRARWNVSRDQIVTFLRTGPNTPVLLLMGLIAASCAFAPNKFYAIQESLRWGAGVLLFFVVAYQFRQSKHLFLLVDTILFLGITTSFLALGQYLMEPAARGTALFGNQQLLGSFMMILLPVAAVVALTEKTSPDQTSTRQLVAQFATIMMAGCLLLALNRSAWMGSLAGLLVIGALMMMTSKSTNLRAQKHKLVLPGVMALIAVSFVLLIGLQNTNVVSRAGTLSNVSEVGSWQARQQHWQGALESIKQHPLFGLGIGQYPLTHSGYLNDGVALTTNGLSGAQATLADLAHNFYLQTAAELGLPGLVLMVAVLVTFMIAGVQRVRWMDAGIRRSLLMASMAGITAFAVDAVSNPSWQLGQVSMFLWLMLGIGVSCLRPRVRQAKETVSALRQGLTA